MKFYAIEPEVAGGFGANTKLIRTPGKPVTVVHLHYQLDGWLGDELLESTPCFIVSRRLGSCLQAAHLTGFSLDEVEVSKSQEFADQKISLVLPEFAWMKIDGRAGVDDFGLNEQLLLVISARALRVLDGSIKHAASVVELSE